MGTAQTGLVGGVAVHVISGWRSSGQTRELCSGGFCAWSCMVASVSRIHTPRTKATPQRPRHPSRTVSIDLCTMRFLGKKKNLDTYANSSSAAFVKSDKGTSSQAYHESDSDESDDEGENDPVKFVTVAPPRRDPDAKRPKMAFKVETVEEKNGAGKVVGEYLVCCVKPRSRSHVELLDFIKSITMMNGFWGDTYNDGKKAKKMYHVPLALFIVFYNDIRCHVDNMREMPYTMLGLPSLIEPFMQMLEFYYHDIVSDFEAEKKAGQLSIMVSWIPCSHICIYIYIYIHVCVCMCVCV